MNGNCSRRAVLALGAGATAALMTQRANADPLDDDFRKIEKGVWTWRIEPDGLDDLMAFVGTHGIGRVLLSFRGPAREALLAGEPTFLRRLGRFRERKVFVGALTGDPNWPRRPLRMPRSLEELIRIQERYRPFDGLHLDVEPHSLRDWREGGAGRAVLMQGLLDFFGGVRARAPNWTIDAALHPQYSRLMLPSGENFMRALMGRIDSVALMAYRDDARRLLALAMPSIEIFERASMPWRLGVLVHADKENGISYWGTSRGKLVAEMKLLEAQVRAGEARRGYRGLMFEDLDGLRSIFTG